MQIVKMQKDKLHLMRLTLSDGAEILIDKDVCGERCLKEGCCVEDVNSLVFESEYVRAKSRAIWYLDRAAHTEKGLYEKLLKAGFKKEASAKVIARLKEVDLLNDNRYAENYAERLVNANVSKREALQKMLQKGVSYDLAKTVLQETETDEQTQINNLISKKYRTKLMSEDGAKKVFAALVRKGFPYSEVRAALKSYIENYEEDYV